MIGLYKVFITIVFFLTVLMVFKNNKNVLSAPYFVLLSFLIIFYLPLLFNVYDWTRDADFLFILSLGFLGLLVGLFIFEYGFGLSLSRTLGYNKACTNKTYKLCVTDGSMRFVGLIVMLYYGINIIIVLQRFSWSITAILLRDRIGIYSETAISSIEEFVKPIALILVSFFWGKNDKSKFWGYIIWASMILYRLFIQHGRFEVVMCVVLLVIYHHEHVKRVSVFKLVIAVLCVMLFMSVGNYARTGNYTVNAFLPQTVIKQVLRASSGSVVTFHNVYNKLSCDYFKQYLVFLPISFIPHIIWKGKPVVSYFWRLTKEIYGVFPYSSNSRIPVLTSTILGEAFHEGGRFNVFIVPVLYSLLIKKVLQYLKRYEHADLILYSVIIHIPMDIRGGMSSIIIKCVTTALPLVAMTIAGVYKLQKTEV